ncbi:DEAD/DEAH box helicase [Brevibacillus parabrevis]|jgi:Superfamily II DNA/RNA helicases, SNF2 family|uniref:DEAD/DEAH box helicase n=1 Tax=Brevibacillus parabrevis TaxID=54914 RepID=UPI0024917C3B|nr:DEAD/DEAH box helicase [Brevibacillus parabrevis]
MNYFLNQQKIKQICGDISFKKGKRYFAEKRVKLIHYHPGQSIFRATVNSGALFDVTIKKDNNGYIYAECTCPRLSSYHKSCQHVAAVLLCLHDIQVNGLPTQQVSPRQTPSPLSAAKRIEHPEPTPARSLAGDLGIDDLAKGKANTRFKGKLFLDRIKNRLLAGLEFHYDAIVMNPLEAMHDDIPTESRLSQLGEKEQEILRLMKESLGTRTESGYYWSNDEEEYHFLVHMVPQLQSHVEIHATTAVRDRICKADTRPTVRVEVDERTDWLIFQFDMQGVPEVEIREVLLSLSEKRKFYRLRDGRLLSLEAKQFADVGMLLEQLNRGKAQVVEGKIRVPFVFGLQQMAQTPESILTKGSSFQQWVEELKNPRKSDFPLPPQLAPILKSYQQEGFQWLKRLAQNNCGGILADDMGLGKTLQSLAFIAAELSEIRAQGKPVLVVAPSSLMYNWLHEFARFTPEVRVTVVDGLHQERKAALERASETDVFITSYPLLRMDSHFYQKRVFHTLFLDEAQAFKNADSLTAKALQKLQAANRFALTGTPIENNIEDVWAIFHVVFPGLMPDRQVFHELSREKIAQLIAPFMLRRMKAEVLRELPSKMETILTSDLLPEQKKLYAAYLARLKHVSLKHVGKDTFQENQMKILAGLTRLRQLCCHPGLFLEGYAGGSAKLAQLGKLVVEYRQQGKRMLIFSQFTEMLAIISKELSHKECSHFYLDGNTAAKERVQLCDRFNKGEREVFLISLKAGGTGLNLTGADTVILYDLWWNPAVEQQAADRAYRLGQKKDVQVIKLIAQGTIEERIHELQTSKQKLFQEVIQPGENQSWKLTEEGIRDILEIR